MIHNIISSLIGMVMQYLTPIITQIVGIISQVLGGISVV